MQKDNLYELTCEHKHLELIIDALSNYICSQYDGITQDVVNVDVTTENIKIASDIQSVLKYELGVQQGVVRHTPKQSAESTGLVWVKEIDLENQSNLALEHEMNRMDLLKF